MAKKKNELEGYASKGGKARAESLTPEERSEIARNAVMARWHKEHAEVPKATHDGPLTIGDITFDCAVLDDGTRVISESNFMEAMGMYRSGALSVRRKSEEDGGQIPLSLAHKNLKPFVIKHFGGVHYTPIQYRTKKGALNTSGIKAEVLPKICDVWLDARKAGVLGPTQQLIADKAEILIRGLAQVGIVALVDEATGYQYERQKSDLQEFLKQFLSEELRRWVKTFPNEYFRQLCRLRNTTYRPDMKLPMYFGHLTNDVVYKRLAPYVLTELQKRNKKTESGHRTAKHFQYLSEDVGNPQLLQHLGLVLGLMKVSDTWADFIKLLDRAAPPYDDMPLFASANEHANVK
ncbi:MAG: P63C domain-containing protein [Ignavibacteriae bacterium]|nr:P63C domain-containing protein [Ignavibacteriota bacterium]